MNYLAILVASVAQFIIGAIWYMPVFGKIWGKIHGFDTVPQAQQKEMMKGMGKLLVIQFIGTVVTTTVLWTFLTYVPDWNVYVLAGFMWIGFIVPTQVSAVLFGGTKPEWVMPKILIMAGGAFLCIEAAAIILKAFA